MFIFKINCQDKTTSARTGMITTPHGNINTPAFVPVGTQATVKSLTPHDLKDLGTQIYFVNTYHAYLRPGLRVIKKFGGLHNFMNWDKPVITDSGGFQVFSLGRNKFKFKTDRNRRDEEGASLVKIDADGVTFRSHWDGSLHRFTPESSIEIQYELGSDIHIAFDECTPFPATAKYARTALARTHNWSLRSLKRHRELQGRHKTGNYQALYGVVQGSVYEELRRESAKFIAGQDFDGIAIGGVSVGESKAQMRQVCDWVVPNLPENKPRHLLGVGEIDDIFEIVERGIDTFDCVQPTRLARMGQLLTNSKILMTNDRFTMDILNNRFKEETNPADPECGCFACRNFSAGYLHHLFKTRELLGYRLASLHNLSYVIGLTAKIRTSIEEGRFLQFKEDFFKIR